MSTWPPLIVIRASSIDDADPGGESLDACHGTLLDRWMPHRDADASRDSSHGQLSRHVPDQPEAEDHADGESGVGQRRRAHAEDQRRGDEQAGDHDADGQGVAGPGQLADQALEALEVEPDVQLAALDRIERLAQQVGQERGDPLEVLGGLRRLVEQPERVEPAEGELAEERLELAGDVEVGVEVPAHALDGHQRADQEHQVRRDVQVVGADERDQLAEQEAQVDPVERQLGVGVDQLADVAAEGPGIDLVAADVERVERAEHPVGVLGDQAGQQVGDPLAGPAVELAEHAVVERGDDAAGQDAEVARDGDRRGRSRTGRSA